LIGYFKLPAAAAVLLLLTTLSQFTCGRAFGQNDAGPIILYDFADATGNQVKDRAGVGEPIDLRIEDLRAVKRSAGSIEVRDKTTIRTDKTPTRLIDAIRKSGELTIEAWLRPDNDKQDGPARIVTLSRDTSNRNFTLGQEGDQYDARLRTTKSSSNGLPSLASPNKSLKTDVTHVVYTRDKGGQARLFINGEQKSDRKVDGDMRHWDGSYRLALANELTGDRPWKGTLYQVAIYDRALSPSDVQERFEAGKDAAPAIVRRRNPLQTEAAAAQHFIDEVAPLLARQCLECHGWKSTKGKLDLSRRDAAMAGGKSGRAIVPHNAAASELWKQVASDDMPADRPPLSQVDKAVLRDWIEAGAPWPREVLEQSVYSPDAQGATNILRRLTVREYIETVKYTVGVDIETEANERLPRDLRADGFSNTAYNLAVDLQHVEAYADLAQRIVAKMDIAQFAARFSPSMQLDDAHMTRVIRSMGKWLLRGPLAEHEVTANLDVARAVAKEGGNYHEAVGFVVEAMLQSPRFIYRIERQRGEGDAQPADPYDLASRLSYILWGGPPDRELLHAADTGALRDAAKVQEQVDRMLADPRAVEHSLQFIAEWLHLARLDYLRPHPAHFPDWDKQLADDMRAETLAFFKEIAWKQNRPLHDLFNADVTFVTPKLARHYGLAPKGDRLTQYDLSNVPSRGGLLTQGSVLTVGGDEASMVTRGLFVLHDVLRGSVADPPPCGDTTPVPTKPGLSQRKIAEARLANPQCGGCHAQFEPFAFGLEKFDGLGGYHEKDHHGNALRDDGEIRLPGSLSPISYQSASQLMDILANSSQVRETITWKATQWAIGRPLNKDDPRDMATVGKIHQAAQAKGGTYKALMTAIVMSDLVQQTRTESVEASK